MDLGHHGKFRSRRSGQAAEGRRRFSRRSNARARICRACCARRRRIRLSGRRFSPAARRACSSTKFSAIAWRGIARKTNRKGQTFTKSVGQPVLPDFLSVIFDPTRAEFQGTSLNGFYLYDDEGVKARPVTVVDNGILKTFLMSRSPIQGFAQSNGHGRRAAGAEVVSRQSNLFVESSKKVSDAELRNMLIAEVKRQGKPYGLFFDQVTGGYTTTARRGLQAFTVIPLVVYRVYPDGRPDELIRGADIVGTPLASFAKIMATSDRMEVFNGICGAESGDVPVSAIAPAILVSEIEIQRKERSQDRPPYLSRPATEDHPR